MSALTLGLAVERLPASVLPIADPPDLAGFDPQVELRKNINRTLSRFHAEGKWEGLVTSAAINAYQNGNQSFITLPRNLNALLATGKQGAMARRIQSEWYQYLPGGYGVRPNDQLYCGPLQDLGAGFTTFRDIPEPAQLRIRTDEAEDNYAEIILRMLDQDGNKVYSQYQGATIEGVVYSLDTAPITIGLNISRVYGVSKTITQGRVKLYYIDGVNEVMIGDYEPGERVVSYRRYLAPSDSDVITGLFKREHVWAYSDNDPLYPDNLEALKLGLFALNNEEKADVERAQYYMDKAILLLNNELREYFSGLEGNMQFQSWITGGMINIR